MHRLILALNHIANYVINHDFKDEHIATNSGTAYANFLFAFASGLSRFVSHKFDPSYKVLQQVLLGAFILHICIVAHYCEP